MPCQEGDIKNGNLLIRYTQSDTGARPIDPCTGYWLSPDVWLEGGIDATTAKVGVPNTIKVRVSNISQTAMQDVNVQVWVCDYTAGVSPQSAIPSAGGATGLTGFVSQVDPGGVANAQIVDVGTWTPAASDATLNGGHVCLAANVYAETPTDGIPIPPGTFKFCCDTHHGQRNIAVRAVASGEGQNRMEFRMIIANPAQKGDGEQQPVPFVVRIQDVTRTTGLGKEERELIASGPYARLDVHPSDEKVTDYGVGNTGCRSVLRTSEMRENKILLPPGGRMPVAVRARFSANEKAGGVHVFDITQEDSAGEVIGGARLLALIVP